MWKTILAYIFILFSGQTLTAQTIDTNSNVGEIFVNGDALYYSEGEVAGKIIFQAKSGVNESKFAVQLHNKKKVRLKISTSVEKEKRKVVKSLVETKFNYLPSKSRDFFSSKSNTISCAVNQIVQYTIKAKGKSISNKIDFSSFNYEIEFILIVGNYVNSYKLPYYLRIASIRPPPIS